MKLIRNRARAGKRALVGATFVAALFLLAILALNFHSDVINAESLENHARVWPSTELKYYLTVKYDGVDKNGVQSSDTVRADVKGGVVEVTDKLPDGLIFKGFETTATGKIGAVKRDDPNTVCVGRVVDDTQEETLNTGTWDGAHENYYYHGLHYNESTRTISFKAVSVQAGCDLNVGIITETPELPDGVDRIDFYNTAHIKEGLINKNSNTVHAWMGRDGTPTYSVTYQYTGTVPGNAPGLPEEEHHAAGTNVGVAMEPEVEGYTFSGWTTSGATIENGSFIMPINDVTLVGMFTEKAAEPEYTVSYDVTGETPEDYVSPKTKSYKEGDIVVIDSALPGDTIDDYVFSGWASSDVTIVDGTFVMPDHAVVIHGSFSQIEYTVEYHFMGDVLPQNAASLLPVTQYYHAGDTVTVAAKPTADGYAFEGWYSDNTFTMPAQNVTINGEWVVVKSKFAPTVSIEIIDEEDSYRFGQTVHFKITVTNTANFAITNAQLLENLDGAVFVDGSGYEILADDIVMIPTIAANGSVVVYADFYIANNEATTITNEVELSGATAANENYEIDTEQDYTARSSFDVELWQDLPVPSGIATKSTTLYVILTILGGCGIGMSVVISKRKINNK